MATQLQLRRGTTSENGSFTGALGEVTVDTDKDTLVVHDGATAGGFEMAKADGSNMTAIDVGDNVQLKMGTGDDLAIYHDGNNSYIKDAGTGDLYIQGEANVRITDGDGNKMFLGQNDGEVQLYHNGSEKFNTTSSGVAVTGDLAVSGNLTLPKDDALIFIKETDGTNIAAIGDLTGAGQGGAFYYNHGGTAVIQLKTYEASTIGHGLNVGGNLGVGTSSPTTFSGFNTIHQKNTSGDAIHLIESDGGIIGQTMVVDAAGVVTTGSRSNHPWRAVTNDTEALRIDTSQNVSIPNGDLSVTDGLTSLTRTNGSLLDLNRSNDGILVYFKAGGIVRGNISISGSTTSYNTSSDYRLKEDVQAMSGATDRLKELKPVNFAWKADGSRVDGFIAHEAQEVVPESVTGSKDAMMTEEYEVSPAVYEDVVIPAVESVEAEYDEEGNVVVEAVEAQEERTEQRLVTEAVMGEREVPDYQGIDQAKLVPLLVATIQELEARITALEA